MSLAISAESASLRDAAARYRQAAREESGARLTSRAELSRDQRVEEAKAVDRPALARAPEPHRLLDVLV